MGLKKTKDVNHWNAIKRTMQELDGAVVKAGLTTAADGQVVEYGTYNEMGTATIPARSFIRSTADKQRKEWEGLAERLLGKVIDGVYTARTALDRLGKQAQGDIRKTIATLRTPPNAESTKRRKNKRLTKKQYNSPIANKPLIDTGRMYQSISYEVTRK